MPAPVFKAGSSSPKFDLMVAGLDLDTAANLASVAIDGSGADLPGRARSDPVNAASIRASEASRAPGAC